MRTLIATMTLGLLTMAGAANAQVKVQVNLPVPVISFPAPPPLVMVSPGIQVVEDHDNEVFMVEGNYWVRRDNRWYRSHDHRGTWVVAPPPRILVALPPGQYRHYRRGEHEERKEERREERHEERDDHHKGKGDKKH